MDSGMQTKIVNRDLQQRLAHHTSTSMKIKTKMLEKKYAKKKKQIRKIRNDFEVNCLPLVVLYTKYDRSHAETEAINFQSV